MIARARYLARLAARTRAPLLGVAVALFLLIGVFADPRQEVGKTWAQTAMLCGGLSAWLVGAILYAEPPAQAELVTTALGGARHRAQLHLLLVVLVSAALAAAFVAYPLLLSQTLNPRLFVRAVHPGDVAAAALAQLSAALVGGAVAVLFGPPQIQRRPTAAACVLACLIALVALAGPLGDAGGPIAVARALTDAPAGHVTLALVVACASSLGFAAIALAAGRAWLRYAP